MAFQSRRLQQGTFTSFPLFSHPSFSFHCNLGQSCRRGTVGRSPALVRSGGSFLQTALTTWLAYGCRHHAGGYNLTFLRFPCWMIIWHMTDGEAWVVRHDIKLRLLSKPYILFRGISII